MRDHRRAARGRGRDGAVRRRGRHVLQGLHGLQGRADGRRRAVHRRARADGQDRRARDGPLRERRRGRALPEGGARARATRDPKFHASTRPPEVEGEATSRAIRLAEWTGRPLFVVHVTCEEAVKEIQAARDRGLPIFGETCIQYLYLTVDDLDRPGFEGAKYVCSPPLREAVQPARALPGAAPGRAAGHLAPTTARSTSRSRRSSGSGTSRRSRTACRRSSTGSRCSTTAPCAKGT